MVKLTMRVRGNMVTYNDHITKIYDS